MGIASSPDFRVWLYGPMKVEKLTEGEDYEEIPITAWKGRVPPRRLLKALLHQPNRQASRAVLLEMLWPEPREQHASEVLSKAVGQLRRILQSNEETLLMNERRVPFYHLAGQERIWVDVDAAFGTLDQVEHIGRASPDALPLLEQTVSYFNRGALLEGETWPWIQRERTTEASYRSRRWLAEAYIRLGRFGQAQMIFTTLLKEDQGDVDILAHLLNLLTQQGMTHQAQRLYAQAKERLSKEQLLAIGRQYHMEE